MSRTVTASQRRQVIARANGVCEYCQSPQQYAVQSFECEHIYPLSRGGKSVLDNLALSCGGCNRSKASKTEGVDPETGLSVGLFNPRRQLWAEHFVWNNDFSLIIGLTATGRTTIQTLRLNRPGLVNLRRVLLLAGEHPSKQK